MTDQKRRVIDPQQRMPENVAAAPPHEHRPTFHKTIDLPSSVQRDGGRKHVPVTPRAIPILPSPKKEQVPTLMSAHANSQIARNVKDGLTIGGAEGQVQKQRKEQAQNKRDIEISRSVIK